MLTSALERFLVVLHKRYAAVIVVFIEAAEQEDPELGRLVRSIGDRIMGPSVDLEAKRIARESAKQTES